MNPGFLYVEGRPLGRWGVMRPRVANPVASLLSYLSQFKKNSSLKLFAKVTVKEFGPGKGPFDD